MNPRWIPPEAGVVRDPAAAIGVARLIWFSMNPDLPPSSADVWNSRMAAMLEHGVWKVAPRPLPSGSVGGGLEIDISASDGRVVGIYVTQ